MNLQLELDDSERTEAMGIMKTSVFSAIVAGSAVFATAQPAQAQFYFSLGFGDGYYGSPGYGGYSSYGYPGYYSYPSYSSYGYSPYYGGYTWYGNNGYGDGWYDYDWDWNRRDYWDERGDYRENLREARRDYRRDVRQARRRWDRRNDWDD